MKDLSKQTRAALKQFDRITKRSPLSVCITTADNYWYPGRKGAVGDTLTQCQTEFNNVLYAHCPKLCLGAFVTFPRNQGTATNDQIIQALRLECIRRSEELA